MADKVLTMQKNWIGRSQGPASNFQCSRTKNSSSVSDTIEVFTTRVDTIFGATCVFLAPEHEIVEKFALLSGDAGGGISQKGDGISHAGPHAALTGEIEKGRFFTGRYARNPGERAHPDLIANFVLGDYGTARSWPCRRTTSATSSSRQIQTSDQVVNAPIRPRRSDANRQRVRRVRPPRRFG